MVDVAATAPPITGSLAGVPFRFETDTTDLAEYAHRHLASLRLNRLAAPTVSAVLRWHDGQPPRASSSGVAPAAGLERVDRDIYTDGTHLEWFRVDDLRDLFLRFIWEDGRLAVAADFYYRLGNSALSDRIRRTRQWSRRAALRSRRFTTLLYYLVYYPCWWWLEHTRDLHPVHAAGVSLEAGTVLLAGPSGVGKSTLAVALALTDGARLLSDSFVLHNDAELRAVHEPILLDAWSRDWLGPASDALRPVDGEFSLGRRGYHLSAGHAADGGRAALLLFPRRAQAITVRRLSAAAAHQRLSAADMIINDLRRYWAFAAVLEQLAPSGLVARREAQLARLAAAVPAYEIGFAATTSRATMVRTILQLLEDRPLRAVGSRQ